MNGGYLMVSKDDTKIYDKLQLGLKAGKPILWYESVLICFYIDTISGGEITSEIVDDEEVITYGDIILTKGGKTITVSYDGTDATVNEEGEIQPKLYKYVFNVSDMYVSFYSSKLYKFETNKTYTINSDDDYKTCILTGDLLQSLKDLITDLPRYTSSLVSDNNSILTTGANIYVESEGTMQFQIYIYNNPQSLPCYSIY